MPQDPEVNLKFNAESDKAQAQLQVLVDKFEHIAAAVTRAGERLQAFEADARELAENAERLDMLAYNTGKIEALREVNQVFSAGLATVSGYGEKVTECTNALIDFGGNAAKVLTEFQQGNLTMEQASAKLDRYSAAAAKNEKAVNSFAAAVKRGFDELAGAASLDDALSAWETFEENVDQARQQITAAAEAIQQKKEALGELKEELDSTSESYAEQAQHLAKQEVALNKQAAELQKLRAELDKLSASARDAFSSKNMGEDLSGSMSQLTSLSSKLEVTLAHTTQALSKLEVAETSCAAAAQKEAEQEQAATYAMRLSAMSKTKLADETRKLIAARKQAAAVGDVAAYQKLTAQLGQCRTAMRALLQQQQMTKIAMLQQVQTAAMMGSQISSLAGQIRSGSTDIAGMASQVMSLGMALKAGLGPIGWVMMAIQGLSTILQIYINRGEAAIKVTEAQANAQKSATEAAIEAGKAMQRYLDARNRIAFEEAEKERQREVEKEKQKNEHLLNAKKQRIAGELQLLDQEQAAEEAHLRVRIANGKATEIELLDMQAKYEEKRSKLNSELAKAEADAVIDKTSNELKASKNNVEALEKRLEGLKEKAGNDVWEQIDDSNLDWLEDEIAALKSNISKEKAELNQVETESKAWKDQNIVEAAWQALQNRFLSTENQFSKLEGAVAMQRGSVNSATEQLNLKYKRLVKQLGLDPETATPEEVGKMLEIRKEKKDLEKRLKEEKDKLTQAKKAKKLAEDGAKTQEEINKAKKDRLVAEKEARAVEIINKKIKKDLAEIEEKYKVKRDYAEQDAKTMSAIHAEDLENLQLRRAEYESLKNTPEIDADTLKEINKKIKDIDAQTHRVQKSMKQAALEAQKSIGALQPLGQKAKVPNLQGPLRQAEKSFTELAKKAERQAANGDLKGLERSKKSMQRLALGMERMTGFTGKATKLYEQVTEDLKKVQQGETKGLTAKQQTENNIRKKLGAEDRYRTKGAQAAEQSAKAAEAEAKAHELNAKNASQSVQANQPVNKTVQLSSDVNSLRSQVQQMETAQQTLNSNMGGLGGAVGKLAAAAENTAALAGKMATAAAAALGRLEKKISALEKQIDRLNRKI